MSLGFSLRPDSLTGGQVLTAMILLLCRRMYLPPCRLSGILVEQLARVLLSSLLSPSIQKALNIHPAGASFGTNSQSAPGPANTLKQIQVQFPH